MNFWSNYPFSRICIPFLLGVIFEIYFPNFQFKHLYVAGALFIIFLLSIFFVNNIRKQWFFGVLLIIMMYSFGHNYVGVYTKINHKNHYKHHINTSIKSSLLLKITEPLLEKPKSVQVKGEVIGVFDNDSVTNTEGTLLVYLQKDSLSKQLSIGDTVLLFAQLNEISGAKNPGQFNYQRFLQFHQIYHQAYCSSEWWHLVGKNHRFSFRAFADDFRKKMLTILEKSGLGANEFAVASALILGYKESLDDDLVLAYSSSGAMHVLAVSGLHVGIIYMVLNFFLSFLDKSKRLRLIKALLLLLGVWFYAFVTGLSPSVMRASTMFSFIILGSATERNTNIFNTIFASAFFLLVYNPYLIMQVGFQLSYLAVIGIVYIQPRLYKQLYVKNWLLDKVWAITAVSVAAQIATFPLGLLYFHQFPNYFFVSNLIVIPAATVILGLGILVLIMSPIPLVFSFLGMALHYTINFLNKSVFVIEELPYSLTTGISITVLECWLIYLAIIAFLGLLVYQKRWLFLLMLSVCSLVIIIDFTEDLHLQKQNKLIVYDIKDATAINFISSYNNYFLTDSSTFNDNSTMLFNVKHNWDNLDLKSPVFIEESLNYNDRILFKDKHFIQFLDIRLVIIDDTFVAKQLNEKIDVDYLVLTKNTPIRFDHLLTMFNFKQVIMDGSMKLSTAKKIAAYASKQGISSYITSERGAFELDFIYQNNR
jgi:competence protein ComEC